jgi:TolB-like protein/class 3 adenylate cyclase/Tfp pilus assembly protein PilF
LAEPIEVKRRLAAIFAADVEGYSRLMGTDEVATLDGLTARREILDGLIASHGGRIANTAGDSVLAEFGSAVDAVRCAMEAQVALAKANSTLPETRQINFRIGVHVGDVMVRAGDLFGDGVNIAARLQTLAKAGGLCVSGVTYDQVRKILPLEFTDLGAQNVKNIEEPIRAFEVREKVGVPSPVAKDDPSEDQRPLALPEKPSIAVLPFQNMSVDPEQEYFADGMVEDIITGLSRSKTLFVIARNSTFTYKGKAADIRQVGRELGVRYVLEGSVRKSGKRVRVTAQLIDASTDAHLWADKFDSDLEDIFDLQDRLTSDVIGAISPQLERAEMERAQRKPTKNLKAYDYYLRALFVTQQYTREGNVEALRLTKIAISLDPSFARAYAYAADNFGQRKAFGWVADAAQERVETRQFAERAIQLDKDDPLVLASSGQAYSFVLEEPENGVALLTRAVALDPNLAIAHNWSGWGNIYLGNVDAAIEQFSAAIRLSPLDPRLFLMQTGMGYAHFLAGRYEDGLLWATRAMQNQSNFPGAQRTLMANLAMMGRIAEARRACNEHLKTDPTFCISDITLRTPLRRPEDVEKLGQAYRIAGVPE